MHEPTRLERTATDEKTEQNRDPAPIAPLTRDEQQTEADGLPPGMNDDRRSPLDPLFYDPASEPAGGRGEATR